MAAVELSPADFQKAVDEIKAQKPAQAMRESLALRDRVKKSANAEELKTQLESLNQSINQLSSQSSIKLFTVTCITVSLLCLGYIGKNYSDIRSYSKASAAVVDDLDKIDVATRSGVNLSRFSEKLNDLTSSWNHFEETNKAYAKATSFRKLHSAVLNYRLAKDFWAPKNDFTQDLSQADLDSTRVIDEAEAGAILCWAKARSELTEAKTVLAKEASFPLGAISACVIPILLLGAVRFNGLSGKNAIRIAAYGVIAVCLFLAYKSYTEETARLFKP